MFACQDDIYTVSRPTRVDRLHVAAEEELWAHARTHLNLGKTQVWKSRGTEPSGARRSGVAGRPHVAANPTRIESSWGSHWPRRIRSAFLGDQVDGTTGPLNVPPSSHVRGHKGEFLVACSLS